MVPLYSLLGLVAAVLTVCSMESAPELAQLPHSVKPTSASDALRPTGDLFHLLFGTKPSDRIDVDQILELMDPIAQSDETRPDPAVCEFHQKLQYLEDLYHDHVQPTNPTILNAVRQHKQSLLLVIDAMKATGPGLNAPDDAKDAIAMRKANSTVTGKHRRKSSLFVGIKKRFASTDALNVPGIETAFCIRCQESKSMDARESLGVLDDFVTGNSEPVRIPKPHTFQRPHRFCTIRDDAENQELDAEPPFRDRELFEMELIEKKATPRPANHKRTFARLNAIKMTSDDAEDDLGAPSEPSVIERSSDSDLRLPEVLPSGDLPALNESASVGECSFDSQMTDLSKHQNLKHDCECPACLTTGCQQLAYSSVWTAEDLTSVLRWVNGSGRFEVPDLLQAQAALDEIDCLST